MSPSSSPAAAAAPSPSPQNAHKWIIAIAVMLGTFLEVLDTSILNVALPHMQGSFSASVDEITWVVTSYLVANGIMIPMTGWVSARFGRKRYFLLSVVGFVAASAACGAAQTLHQMVIFRLIQGLCGAAMQPSSQAIMMETFPPEEQAMAMAFWGIGIMVAPILGPTIGGWITDNWSWRWNFYINVPVGIAAITMVTLFLHDPPYLAKLRNRSSRIDYTGIALLTVGLGLFQFVIDRGGRADWFATPWVVYCSAGSVLSLLTLVFHELRTADPIIDLRILAIPTFTLATMILVLQTFVAYGINLLNPIFLQEYMGYTALQAGLVMAPRGFGSVIVMFLAGNLERHRISARPLIGLGLLVSGFALWQMSDWTYQISFWQAVWPTVLLSSGFATIFPILSAGTLQHVARERMGYAASLYSMLRNMGAAVGISVISSMLVTHEQIHQSYLATHFSLTQAWEMAQASSRMPGAPHLLHLGRPLLEQQQGMAMVYRQVQAQAALLAVGDIYRLMMFMTLVILPPLLLIWAIKAWRPSLKRTPAEAITLSH